MKIARKGFTLVELLIVIGVIGILSSMSMMGGSEATNIANANKIVEEFRIIGAAMNMYYADNRADIEAELDTSNGETLAKKIKAGIKAYMKNTDSVSDGDEAVAGKYQIKTTDDGAWWLCYKLPDVNSRVASILTNKAASEGLMKTAASKVADTSDTTKMLDNFYDGTNAEVYYQVR